jgi:hypothetical protein
VQQEIWPQGWPHEAPETPLTVAHVEQVMRSHSACRPDECARKAAAIRTMTRAGQPTPDPPADPRIPAYPGYPHTAT